MNRQDQKAFAAAAALDYVESDMILGLGSGSTAELFIADLGAAIAQGSLSNIRGIPTSKASAIAAEQAGVPLMEPDHADRIDLTVDGADEVDGDFNLIKGGGACLLREKIIAHASDLMVVIVDESKLVEDLGAFALPVEVDPFSFTITAKKVFDVLQACGVNRPEVTLRNLADTNTPLITDGGHYILDCACGVIPDAELVTGNLNLIPGVVENGLFVDLARTVIVGASDGVQIMEIG
jgi:ribose 5-phosphate isomerase A